MLCRANVIKGCDIEAMDGAMGKIVDFYFDDGSWQIRYLVVDVGSWLKHKQVLLIPEVVAAVDPDECMIDVTLSKAEVAISPDVTEQLPVSRQVEVALHHHYDWPPYWDSDPVGMAALGHGTGWVHPGDGVKANRDVLLDANSVAVPEVGSHPIDSMGEGVLRPSGRLRSLVEVRKYHINALDGEIGHVVDFFVEGTLSEICYLVVDTNNWLPSKKVVVPPAYVDAIHWDGSKVDVALTKEEIRNAPEYREDSASFINPGFEAALHDYYRRKSYYTNM